MLPELTKLNMQAELFQRHPNNPILTARDWPYPAHTVFNAGACQMGDETIVLEDEAVHRQQRLVERELRPFDRLDDPLFGLDVAPTILA